jgi:ATP-binding cassette subfamily D (ALD) protein 3
MFAVPSSLCNSGLDYLQRKLAIMYRERLTYYFNRKYLSGLTYYHVVSLDERVPNPDQRLTQDIDKFSTALSNLWSNVSKPVLDVVLFSKELAVLVGKEGPLLVFVWYLVSGIVIKFISPPFSRLTVIE